MLIEFNPFSKCINESKLSEYHTGFRAFSSDVLRNIKYNENSDDLFLTIKCLLKSCLKVEIAEIICPTKYFEEASSINFKRSSVYGLGVLMTS